MKNLTLLLPILASFLFALLPVYAADITVDENCSLADAIKAANMDEAVGGCPAGDGADVIRLSADMTLGKELPRVTTEISIEGGAYRINGAGAFRLFFVEASGMLTIDRLTLLDGKAREVASPNEGKTEAGGAIINQGVLSISNSAFSGNSADRDGGAILNAGLLNINDSAFSGNSADDGGAIYNFGELSISGGAFSDNSADREGGAILNAGLLSISNSAFSGNSADAGGVIYNFGELHVNSATFTDNSAYYRGGATFNESVLSIDNSAFSGNSASLGGAIHNVNDLSVNNGAFSGNSAHIGGAINNLGELSVTSSRFSGNLAGTSGAINNSAIDSPGESSVINSIFTGNSATGGGAIGNDGELSIANSYFAHNSAHLFGGAIANVGTLSVSNSTFYRNAADKIDDSAPSDDSVVSVGGSLYVFGYEKNTSTATLTHVTMARNSSEGQGGSIFVDSIGCATVNLRNSIIAGGTGGDCVGPLAENFGNLIEDRSCDAKPSGDLVLGELVEPEDGSPAYFPLLEGSPAIDTADPTYCIKNDQIGTVRPQGTTCDIGAIEYVLEE
ncbi:MAG: hypothetical protein OXG60_09280 [Chloroflexi bacterium]|nr:hypothetical protein [Chloroflexota bacterium]